MSSRSKASEKDKMHVLAVDDSPVDRAVIARLILQSSNYKVTTVESGKRALELLGLDPNVGMIITDYWMPEMTGFELLKRVKGSSKLREIPVVIMSSENVPSRINKCMEEGAEDFLLKPVRPPDVSSRADHGAGRGRGPPYHPPPRQHSGPPRGSPRSQTGENTPVPVPRGDSGPRGDPAGNLKA